jgi:membrane-associated protease RseP (regulator of RpoE activity)
MKRATSSWWNSEGREDDVNGTQGMARPNGWKKGFTGLLAATLLLTTTGSADGQQGVASSCPDGATPRGEIGIASFECSNCALFTSRDDGRRSWSFSAEPIVRTVEPDSPADGKIEDGDRLVAIDGHLITTGEGGDRLANLSPGETVSIVVRSGSGERTVAVVPRSECPRSGGAAIAPSIAAFPSPQRVPYVPRPDRMPAPAVAPTPAKGVSVGAVPRPTLDLLPTGWFGFGIQCTECRWSVDDEDGTSEWEFSTPPEISAIQAGSPAEAAGLQRGDVLLEIDGELLDTEEGGRRFGSVKPGQNVRWTYRRDGETRTTTATAAERQAPTAPLPPSRPAAGYVGATGLGYTAADLSALRYSGLVGETSVEVRGAGSVVVNIVDPGREIEIVTADSRTRIRLDEPE